ncbi:MAG: glycerophosphodiester phosphodiesterase [Terrisporobacter sp.]
MEEYNKEKKLKMSRLIKKTFKDFKFNLFGCIYFEMCYRILTAFIFIPILYFIFKYFLHSEGLDTITNKSIISFGLSIEGIVCIFIMVILAFCLVFIEIGALTYIGVKSHRREKVKALDGLFNITGILKDTFDRGMIPLIIITGVIGPLTGIGLCSSLIRNYSIPPFITIELSKTMGGKILYALIIAILVVFLLRWILAIPIVVIEKVKGREAVKRSYNVYKNNRWKLLKSILIWAITIALIEVLLIIITLVFGMGISKYILGSTSISSKVFLDILLIIFYIGFIIASIITTPLFVSFLVELYYELRGNDVNEREFKCSYDYKNNAIYKIFKMYSKVFVAILTLIFIIFSGFIGYRVVFHRVNSSKTDITAHRGASTKAPENTLAAIEEAINQKADYAEIDVQTTKDNKVILLHDSTFRRTAKDSRAPKDMTLDEIEKLDNGSFLSKEFKGEKVPTLEEVLNAAKGKIKLNIELKPKGDSDKLVNDVSEIIEKHEMENEVMISSSNYNSLQDMKKVNPKLKVGYIVIAAFGDFEKLNVDFFCLDSSLVNSNTVYALHALGKKVDVFTINTKELAEKMLYLGVDNIITDDVPMVRSVKSEFEVSDVHDYTNSFYESVLSIIKFAKI